MIDELKAIECARQFIAGRDMVDIAKAEKPVFCSRADALANGVKDHPSVRDSWLISFERLKRGHPLDDTFKTVTVTVDAETGEAAILESL